MSDDDVRAITAQFLREVPEVAAGTVEIKAIARKAGYRTKLAVQSHDPHVDAIGCCVGIRGYRIKNVIDALGGERIELVRWVESPEQLIVNSLQPALIERVILYPAEHRAVVVVQSDQVSLVVGRRDENRQLASELTGWQIEIEERKA